VLRAIVLDAAAVSFRVEGVRLSRAEATSRFGDFILQNQSGSIELTGEGEMEFALNREMFQALQVGKMRATFVAPRARLDAGSQTIFSTKISNETWFRRKK
jgi:hypothetical protein